MKIAIVSLWLIAALLGGLWLKSYDRNQALRLAIARISNERASLLDENARLERTGASLDLERAKQQQIVEAQKADPGLAQRLAVFALVQELKSKRAAAPASPPKIPPPEGPRGGNVFPELLEDPEYGAAYRTMMASWSRLRLARLGVSSDVLTRVAELDAERQLVRNDVKRASGSTQPGYSHLELEAVRRQEEEIVAEIRTLVGDELAGKYLEANPLSPSPQRSQAESPSSIDWSSTIDRLRLRLSYSASPLTSDEAANLKAALQLAAERKGLVGGRYRYPSLSTVAELVAENPGMLSGSRASAFQELRKEDEAWKTRSKLPPSSELPRNKRRTR